MPLTYDITVGIGAGFISLGADQGRPGQGARGPPADVGGRDRCSSSSSCRAGTCRSSNPAAAGRLTLALALPSDRRSDPWSARRSGSFRATIRADVPTDRAGRRAARHLRPPAGLPVGVDGRLRARGVASGVRRARRASPTSWSTSPSRARPAIPRAARSPRRSRASAAPRTRRPTASPPSTGPACRAARRARRWTCSASWSSARARRRRHRPGADRHRRGDPLVSRRPVRVRPDAHPAGAVRRRPAGPRDLRRRGRHPRRCRPRPSATSGRRCTGPRTRSSRSPATWTHEEAVGLADGGVRHRQRRPARVRPGARAPRGPARADRQAGHDPGAARHRRARRCGATTRTRGRSSVLNAVLGDGMSSRLFLGVREEKGLAYDVSSGIVEYADAGALEISAGVDPASCPRRSRRSWRSSCGWSTSPCRPRSSRRRRRTCRAASSCAWTTPATWRRGSAARRRSTTGCSRSTRRSRPSRA